MIDANKYKFSLRKSKVDPRDLMLESIYPKAVALPETWDLRKEMQPIRDQGNQGTCSAQTVAAIKEWQEYKDVNLTVYMSPQFIYNLRENQDSEGMTPRDTMQILFKIGIVTESAYPYNTFSHVSNELKKQAERFKIQGYAQINTIDALKTALFANGPCYIAFPVYNPNKMNFWVPDYPGQQMLGGHAVCVAGYLQDKFIIRNSWSYEWGDRGYTYLPFSEWGYQWECWTSIDAESNTIGLNKKVKKYRKKHHWLRKWFNKNKNTI